MNNKYYLEWKWGAAAGYFEYYDKENKENVQWKPETLNVVDTTYVIKGWDEKGGGSNGSAIYSNAISSFDEDFKVRSGGGVLFEGRYDKKEIEAIPSKLFIRLHCQNENGDDLYIDLKGMNYFNLNEVLKGKPKAIKIKEIKDEGKAIKYKSVFFEATDPVEVKADDVSVEDLPF